MLATFGLSRLEACLDDDTVSPEDVDAFVERARADCAKPAAPYDAHYDVPPEDTVDVRRREGYREYFFAEAAQGLPTRVLIPHGSNPDFQPPRHAYRV